MQASSRRNAHYGCNLKVRWFVLLAVISGISAQQAAVPAQDAGAMQDISGVLAGFVASAVCNGADHVHAVC